MQQGARAHQTAEWKRTTTAQIWGSPVVTPLRAAQLKTTNITQIKELHSLVALTTEQFEVQRDSIL